MSAYHDGRRVEYAVMHELERNGYACTRAASSKGIADVIAIKRGEVLLVNVKRSTMPPPAERESLVHLATHVDGLVPIVAMKPPRQPLEFRRLTGTGPRDWVEWSPDYLIDQCDVADDGKCDDPWLATCADYCGVVPCPMASA